MTKSITDIILLESEKNREKLSGILTDNNFVIDSVVPRFHGAEKEAIVKIKVFTNPLSTDPEERANSVFILHNVDLYPIHLAVRSRLPVKNNWVQIKLPKFTRDYVMADFAIALKELGFDLTDLEHYKLDALTLNRYNVRCTSTNPRFSGTVGFAIVDEIPMDAAPDVNMFTDIDFNYSDNDYLKHSKNFLTYQFCFTKENSIVTKCVSDPDDPNVALANVQIDRHAHFVENIGLIKPTPRYHNTSISVTRMLPAEIYAKYGFQSSFPLGMITPVSSSWELVDRLNELYDFKITKSDIIDLNVFENLHAIRFKSSCLGYVGEIMVDINGKVQG